MKSFLLIYIGCFFLHTIAGAQLYYRAATITTREGLSDNRVTCFLKDREGFIWIGTKNGLNRYDGHSFTIYRPSKQNSISNETINDIAEDANGIIWVATMEGLNRFDPRRNHWEAIQPDADHKKDGLPNFIVWDIKMGTNNLLWIASDVFEFCSYNVVTKKFTHYDWPGFASKDPMLSRLSYRSIRKFTQGSDNLFWLATTGGLVSLDINTKQFHFIGSTHEDVSDIAYDSVANKVFLSAGNSEIACYDVAHNLYKRIQLKPQTYPSSYFREAGPKEIWMGSRAGMIRINDDLENYYEIESVTGLDASLLPGGVNTVFRDKTGISWVGTNNGINKFTRDFRQTAFLPLLPFSDKEDLNKVNSVYLDPVTGDYFACAGRAGKVFVIHTASGEIKSFDKDQSGKIFSRCNAVVGDRKNNVWLLTDENVFNYDRVRKVFVRVNLPGVRPDARFKDMAEDTDGNLWFACFDGGVYAINKNTHQALSSVDPALQRITSSTTLHADTIRKKMWIGTFSEGLFCYDLPTRYLTAYYATDSTPNYAPLSLIHDITQDKKGQIWIATHAGGIFRFEDGKSYAKALRQFSMKDGLSSNNYLSIRNDGDTTLWLLSGQGMSAMSTSGRFLYDVEEEDAFEFPSDASDDVLPHFIGYNAIRKQVLVGMGSGLLFLSSSPGPRGNDYPVRITRVTIGNESISDSLLAYSSPGIPFRHNTISFDFVALEYAYPAVMKYEYRLEGFDEKWMEAGVSHSAKYQNLPPGKYIFQVRARDELGNLSMSSDQFSFRIAPPFWRTSWFVTIVALLIAGLFYTWISYLRQKIKEQKILNYFATSLYGQNTVDDVFWDIAKNCISKLRFEDCVIYQYDEKRRVLVQKAAFGAKSDGKHQILNPIEIPLGKGIVGAVAVTQKAEIVNNTANDGRYIIDDKRRFSEIAVPIMVDGKLFGIIDSEHPHKNYYKRRHLKLLQKIAETGGIKISRYLVEERLRLKIARDLHDEMGSTLTSINIMSKVAMQQSTNDNGVHDHLRKIKENSSRMMESMSDMVWAIDPSNDSVEKIVLRMKEFAEEILEPAGINYYFREEGQIQKIQLNPEERKDIYLIYKEALNNAVKYSEATEINILLKQENDWIFMTIIDNGIGFNRSTVSSGNGLRNMNSRATAIKGTLRVESIPGTGTTVSLHIPIP